jgi:hypothetical protein
MDLHLNSHPRQRAERLKKLGTKTEKQTVRNTKHSKNVRLSHTFLIICKNLTYTWSMDQSVFLHMYSQKKDLGLLEFGLEIPRKELKITNHLVIFE